jgi:hypothetical protein
MTVALWYWRYHQIDYDIWDSEEEAAGIAVGMEDNGDASVAGIQFPDGRLIERNEWSAYAEAMERRDRAESEARKAAAKAKPRPMRKIMAPFTGGRQIEIDADEPSWLG